MTIPTEPIGSNPRSPGLIATLEAGGDDCGLSPFCDDTSTTREVAFAKIRSRVLGTALARQILDSR